MKNLLLFFVVILFCCCEKDHPQQNQLEGVWRWSSTSSGWGSSNTSTSDTQWRLSITSSNIFSVREGANNLVQSSCYYIEHIEPHSFIKSDEHLYECSDMAFTFDMDTMILWSPNVFDGNTHVFIKQK